MFKKILSLCLAALMIATLCVSMASCQQTADPSESMEQNKTWDHIIQNFRYIPPHSFGKNSCASQTSQKSSIEHKSAEYKGFCYVLP